MCYGKILDIHICTVQYRNKLLDNSQWSPVRGVVVSPFTVLKFLMSVFRGSQTSPSKFHSIKSLYVYISVG